MQQTRTRSLSILLVAALIALSLSPLGVMAAKPTNPGNSQGNSGQTGNNGSGTGNSNSNSGNSGDSNSNSNGNSQGNSGNSNANSGSDNSQNNQNNQDNSNGNSGNAGDSGNNGGGNSQGSNDQGSSGDGGNSQGQNNGDGSNNSSDNGSDSGNSNGNFDNLPCDMVPGLPLCSDAGQSDQGNQSDQGSSQDSQNSPGDQSNDGAQNDQIAQVKSPTGTLVVQKVVKGSDASPSEFSFTVDKNGSEEPVTYAFEADGENDIVVATGSYDITEPSNSDYETSYNDNCSNVAVGNGKTTDPCIITNTFIGNDDNGGGDSGNTGTLHIIAVVSGGTSSFGNFSFQVNSGAATAFESDGQNDVALNAGAYTVTETAPAGYTASYSAGCSGTLGVDAEATCTITNVIGGDGTGNSGTDGGHGGKVLGASTGPDDNSSSQGEVLGASCPLITTYMKEGIQNDPAQVTNLQTFLNGEMNSGLPVTGFFGALTTAAVKTFQIKYWQDVLLPWAKLGLSDGKTPTGYVYKTTEWKINDIACPELHLPAPQLP